MRRFLLSLAFLFSLYASQSQIILNEIYTDPSPENQEFFELYNTSLTDQILMDCYTLVVYYDYRENAGDNTNKRGFYVLDFPYQFVGALGYYVGAAGDGTDFRDEFQVQKCKRIVPDFNWNSPDLWNNSGSLVNYELQSDGSYLPIGSANAPLTVNNMFITMKNVVTDGVVYGVFLFYNGKYVNGFLGGSNKPASNVIANMPPLPYNTSCFDPIAPIAPSHIDWSKVTTGEYVIETPGSDNGYIRIRDGKCGEWEKSSDPNQDCSPTGHEHTPGQPNGGGRVPKWDGFALTTQTEICENGIDYAITGVKAKNQGKDAPLGLFPFIVDLYIDGNNNDMLDTDGSDSYVTSSEIIYSASEEYFRFEGITAGTSYLLVFRSVNLGCIEKIVPTETYLIQTTERDYCGNEVDFVVDNANFNTGNKSDFTVSIYADRDGNNIFNLINDGPALATYKEVSSGTFDLGTWTGNYFVVYDVIGQTRCQTLVKSKPAISEPTPAIDAAFLYYCGDDVTGDNVIFNVNSYAGDGPLTVELWADVNPIDDKPDVGGLLHSTPYDPNIDDEMIFDKIYLDGKPVIIVFRTERGCEAIARLLQSCSPLPVNMGSFTAVRNRLKVLLKWETFTEQSNKGFYVQRNVRSVWENRAFVFSAANGGNSNEPLTYTFNDDNNEKGVSQYRIQQVDLDGKVTFTPIRSVKGLEQANRTIVYPNPSEDGKVNVVFEEQGAKNVIVSDISGRMVRRYRNVVNNLVVDGLDPGMYLFQIIDLSTTETSVEKVIIKKR
jgi:hypothetical protein